AESAPAIESHSAPASEEVSETASASEAETTNEESRSQEQQPQRSNAEKRIQQLLAENKRLKSEREAPRTQQAPQQQQQQQPAVDNFIPQSKVGMEMLYHFATNPSEQARFMKLTPFDALREAIQLESALTQGLSTPSTKTRLKPPGTVNGKGAQPKPLSPEE